MHQGLRAAYLISDDPAVADEPINERGEKPSHGGGTGGGDCWNVADSFPAVWMGRERKEQIDTYIGFDHVLRAHPEGRADYRSANLEPSWNSGPYWPPQRRSAAPIITDLDALPPSEYVAELARLFAEGAPILLLPDCQGLVHDDLDEPVSNGRAFSGEPWGFIKADKSMKKLAKMRAPVPQMFTCGACGKEIKVRDVLNPTHTCRVVKEQAVTKIEAQATLDRIAEVEERFRATMARVDELHARGNATVHTLRCTRRSFAERMNAAERMKHGRRAAA